MYGKASKTLGNIQKMVISLAIYILILSSCSAFARLETDSDNPSSRLSPRAWSRLFAANDPRMLDAAAEYLTTLKKVAPSAELRVALGGGTAIGHWFPDAGRTTEVCYN